MDIKEKANCILDLMDIHYGPVACFLEYQTPWQLLIATILSAQCTDDRVNMVTKDLFRKYTSLEDFALADLTELEQDIRSTGFYHNKAKNIIACCQKLLTDFQGEVPSDIEKLTQLAGVGRKTANVVRSHVFHIPSIVVDTHVKRISNMLGLTKSQDPVKIEFDLMEIIPKNRWIHVNTQFIAHGRKVCIARRPQCQNCFVSQYCVKGPFQTQEKQQAAG